VSIVEAHQIGVLTDEDNNLIGKMFAAANAQNDSVASISGGLYFLSETLIRGTEGPHYGGALGGRFGYGTKFENDVFYMHPFCWCESETCEYCYGPLNTEKWGTEDGRSRRYYDPPLFWYKPSNLRITWYKWIGRDMEANRNTSQEEWEHVVKECYASIPEEARAKAKRQRAEESV
jgi:hypothetical protein